MKVAIKQSLAFFMLLALPGCGSRNESDKPKPHPPDQTVLEYRFEFPMKPVPAAGNSYLEAVVKGARTVYQPSSGNDCNGGTKSYSYSFTMGDGPDDFIDITLNARDGIGINPTDARSFQLNKELTSTPMGWFLIMKQSASASDYLHLVTWRLKYQANVIDQNLEIANGGIAMPPAGTKPWEREFGNNLVGATYRIYSLNNLLNTLTATLTVHLSKTFAEPFCSADPAS